MKSIIRKLVIISLIPVGMAIALGCIMLDSFFISNFRSTSIVIIDDEVDTKNLEQLHISGSKFCRFDLLQQMLKSTQRPVYILDAMIEEHKFINGYPDRFLGYHGVSEEREAANSKYALRRILVTGALRPEVETTDPETEASKNNFQYIPLKFKRSNLLTFEDLQRLVEIIKIIPKEAWIHIHCSNGKGRTTVAMVAIDIIKNAPEVSLEDIVQRHKLMGSEDLFDTTVWRNGMYTAEDLQRRKQLIVNFYDYVVSQKKRGLL